jgi:hypothetical protein
MKSFDGRKKPYTSEDAEIRVQEERFDRGVKMSTEGTNEMIEASIEIKRLKKILEERRK